EMRYDPILKHVPIKDGDLQSTGYAVKHYRDWIALPGYDDYWREISDEERFSKINVPAHTSGGWFDIFVQGTINGFTGVRKYSANEKARRETRMIIGAGGDGPPQKLGGGGFRPAKMRCP